MDIFEIDDYRVVIRMRISGMARKGFGQLGRLAQRLDVNASFISQMLAGKKDLSEDQGYLTSEFFEFSEPETAYFLLLIQRERAGNHRLKNFFSKQIEERKRAAAKVKGRVRIDRELGFEEQAVYYSDYLYTAIHTLISIPGLGGVDALSQHLETPRSRIMEIAQWLIQHGLCEGTTEKLENGPRSTYVDRDSPLAIRHHGNWRARGLERMRDRAETDLFFTAPFSVSEDDFEQIKKDVKSLIEKLAKRVDTSEPEVMVTLNLDLFRS